MLPVDIFINITKFADSEPYASILTLNKDIHQRIAALYPIDAMKCKFIKKVKSKCSYMCKDNDLEYYILPNGMKHGSYINIMYVSFDIPIIKAEGSYKNGLREGLWIYRYDNGKKWREGSYKMDKKDGIWTYNNNNGNRHKEGSYKDGIENGLWTYWYSDYDIEIIYEEGSYKDGKKDGLWTHWYDNGEKSSEGRYKDDKRDGLWVFWNKKGIITKKIRYTDNFEEHILCSAK